MELRLQYQTPQFLGQPSYQFLSFQHLLLFRNFGPKIETPQKYAKFKLFSKNWLVGSLFLRFRAKKHFFLQNRLQTLLTTPKVYPDIKNDLIGPNTHLVQALKNKKDVKKI